MRTEIFNDNDNVLLVGEGNFSFAVDLVKLDLNIKITATCYESSLAFESGIKNVDYLNKKLGVRVYLGVDATKLHEQFSNDVENTFDKIIFNFPHTGGKMKINRNRDLIKGFFISARYKVKPNGILLVTLCNGQGGTPADNPQRRWDDSWQIVENAAHGNFLLTKIEPFLAHNFPNYSCVGYRSLEKGFNTVNSLVHIFQKVDEPDYSNIASKIYSEEFLDSPEIIGWKKFLDKYSKRDNDVSFLPRSTSVYPLSFSFDITFSVNIHFNEIEFYKILYRYAGGIIDNVLFLGTYEFTESKKLTRTYRIVYKSKFLPLHRSRVINLHKNVVSNILENHLNVVVTK